MTSRHISNQEFFSRISTLLSTHAASGRGSVFLTQKRMPAAYSSTSTSTETGTSSPASPGDIVVRASNGRHKDAKTKISTVVAPADLETFYTRYAELCKAGMTGMKKRDRSAKKKGKAKKEKKAS